MKPKHKVLNAVFKTTVILVLGVFFLVPMLLVLTSSFTDEITFIKDGYSLGIGKFSFEAYKFVFENESVRQAMINTLIVCFTFVVLSVIVNTLTAYVLSEKKLPGHNGLNMLFVFSMFFSAGMIPTFLVVKGVGLYDTLWALILPGTLSVYNVLLIRNSFYTISPAIKEAAEIDGATPIQILWHVILPISKPIIITTGLMSLVLKWNSWMDVLLYLDASSKDKWTLQYVVRQIMTEFSSFNTDPSAPANTVKNAIIVITVVPLVVLFPFFQKHFQNGITTGSVKG